MTKNKMKRIIQVLFVLVFQGVLLFIAAGTLRWIWTWMLLGTRVVLLIVNFFTIPGEVIEERGRKKENVKKWDKILNGINIIPTVLLFISCGLDFRFEWTGYIPVPVQVTGFLLLTCGSLLFTWAMVSNSFFSTLVRIQDDRGHTVATQGPYTYIRHPGYVGYILMSMATPIALGTLWGLVFSGITAILLVIRTSLEDRTLREELEGYREYAAKVKYRLIPFLW
jgi:protein-S-isoprenylcysteine O-methyltransferase Ste14